MKSKSFDFKPNAAENHSLSDKTIDFVGLYKSVMDSNKVTEKRNSDEITNKETSKSKTVTPKREFNPSKNKKLNRQEPIDISQIHIDGSSLNKSLPRSSPIADNKVTSTPNTSGKNQSVKSIMKTKSPMDQSLDSTRSSVSGSKPKKRNKSVSFMLEETEEVVVKRTKSDDIKVETIAKTVVKNKNNNIKKLKKYQQSEKENKATEVNSRNMEVDSSKGTAQGKVLENKLAKHNKNKKMLAESPPGDAQDQSLETKEKKKKFKKVKKPKSEHSTEPTDAENTVEISSETKRKKLKKKKVKSPPADTTEADGEPAPKSRKKDSNPDIAEDLENLSIGDNAHTLTNLLDEMTVVDKDKSKKLRKKFNKNKKSKETQVLKLEDSEKSEEVKEKVKWKKRKWNKDKKGDADEDSLAHTVIVENLPISMVLNYKKLLTDHFVKHGLIRKIGLAEVYPTAESKPVFTTTLNFYSETAAEQALQENNVYIEGSRIRVKRALPITETTLVVRSYAGLTDQALSSAFHGAGKIRSIRHLVKGKKTMSTAFVEFDGPQAVERAIKSSGDAKIGGKKIHLTKFEIRPKKVKKPKNDGDSDADADSEDSNN